MFYNENATIVNFKFDRDFYIMHSKMFYTLHNLFNIRFFVQIVLTFKCIVHICAHMTVCTYVVYLFTRGPQSRIM